MTSQICYEQPLTKPVRLFLRYEQLMERFNWSLTDPSPSAAHAAMVALLDLYQHGMHVDLKAEALREIERLGKALEEHPEKLGEKCLEQLDLLQTNGIKQVNSIHGQLGAQLRNHHFFNLIRQRILMPGGINSFDLPVYHHWLSQDHEKRVELLIDWAASYQDFNEVISNILKLTRNSLRTEMVKAEQGYYQQMIPPEESVQLLQLCLRGEVNCYPEVSSGKQRFSIRFFDPRDLTERPSQTRHSIDFEVRFCGV